MYWMTRRDENYSAAPDNWVDILRVLRVFPSKCLHNIFRGELSGEMCRKTTPVGFLFCGRILKPRGKRKFFFPLNFHYCRLVYWHSRLTNERARMISIAFIYSIFKKKENPPRRFAVLRQRLYDEKKKAISQRYNARVYKNFRRFWFAHTRARRQIKPHACSVHMCATTFAYF